MKKQNILKKNLDFQRIIKKTRPYKYKNFIIYKEIAKESNYHFGISVSKKIGNAVVRNKIKRQIKSILDKNNYQKNFNCIIIIRRSILEFNYKEIEEDLIEILIKLGLIEGESNEKN